MSASSSARAADIGESSGMSEARSADDVLAFWREAGADKWFKKDDAFDRAIRDDFLATYEAAAAGKLSAWERTPDGALALIIVLDQFPRNMFRNDARAFAADPLALRGRQPRNRVAASTSRSSMT